MSHPLLAKMHDVLLKIKNAFKETPYKEKTNGIIRTIEQVYVKTANGTFESVESEESNGERLSAKQKRALETATIAEQSTNNATVVSSADGAKVQNNLEILADNYEKRPNKTRGFITDLSKSLGLVQHEASQYGTFETRNGKLVTIRVSNHNARVSFFDENGEENGISIVISSHKNKGMLNDGKAHLVEYFYPKQSIERSESKPLADIVKCVSNALDSGKFDDTTGIAQRQEVNMPNSDENVLYSLRQKPEPEKKGTGYKVFVLGKDGKLYPPMVANPNGAATPVGVWLDADAAPVAGESKTGRPQVKQGGKGTQGGSGKLAYRPGWHLGVIPYAIQFNRKDAEGNKTLFPKNFVFAEVEYAADKDYQDEAHAEGINSNGKYQHSLAGLKHLPTDGYYMYRTNPNPETDPWVITGAMKVNRLLTRAEQADIVRNAGREPQKIQEGDIVTDDVVNSINQEIESAPKFSLRDNQGNPLNQDGTLKLEKIMSVDDLTDEDFTNATRNVQLPTVPQNVDAAIGANGKPVIIKKNIFEKNWDAHKFTPAESRKVLNEALYNTDLVGRSQPTKKPNHWVAIKLDEKSPITVLEVNDNKDNVEVVGWYTLDERNLGRIKRQAERNGGELIMLTPKDDKVESLSTPPLSSAANVANSSETSKGNAEKFSLRLQDAINETDTEPTEAQKKSGNYKKGHVKFGGYDYTIENPKGSYRSGVDENGKEWKQKMNDTYGYIRGKFGKDGDHLDMFINDKADLDSWNGDVFVVDQVNPDGKFDEHKVMYGYDSLDEAKKAYLSNYEKGWTGLGNITPVSKAGFDKWLDKSNRKLKPFADYADIRSKTNMDTAPSSFEEFLEHPAVRYSIRNEKERAAAEDAYNFAQENRPDRYSRYAIVNMEKPGAVPQYLEKKAVADNWRRYYNKLKWGNYKLFDLDKPFEDNVKNLVGKFPETFRKKNDTTLSKINELTADYNKRKEEYDAMSNSIQELLNGLMKQGRSLAEAESVIRDWGLYKEMDSKYQNLMGIRKQLNELRSGKVADDERFSLIGKKGAEALDHAEEVSTRLDNLNVARQMEGAKKDVKAIKMATGWERGADGKWRYEIADSKLNDMMDVDGKGKMVKRHKEDMLWTSGKLGEVVVAPELFKAYPKLKDVRLETDSIMNNLPSNGEYNAKTNTITIHADELKYLDSILNHEIQHAIQHIEGFARGGNPEYLQWRIEAAKKEWRARAWADALRDKAEEMGEHYNQVEVEKALIDEYKEMGMDNDEWMPDKETRIKGFNYFARGYADRSFDDDIRAFRLNESTRSDYNSYVEYTKLGGEVEARNVQSRMNMSPEERRKTLAEETEDVARKDQIFLYGGSVSMMGSRVEKRMAKIGDHFKDYDLTGELRQIVNVFSGRNNNQKVHIERDGKSLALMMRQGSENGAGTKHSLYRHFETGVGYITADDILKIPTVMANGGVNNKLRGKSRLVEYTYKDKTGCTYTLLTEKKKGVEIFNDFYTNRKASSLSTFNTSEDAHTGSENAFTSANVGNSYESTKNRQEKYSLKDAEYLEAVRSGDMEKAQKMVYDAARAAGYVNGTDYQGEGSWNAPSASVEKKDFANLDALRESVEEYSGDTNVYGIINGVTTNDDDFYYNPGRVGFRDAAASETSSVLRRLRYDKADANTKVKVYRTVPADVKGNNLMSGDWIALSKQYCIEHGNGRYGEGGYRIIEEEVPIKTIWNDGNDMREFGFDDGNNNEAEKNVPNNRKLLDAVTYDNNGNVIPLSERFNESNDDIRYSLKNKDRKQAQQDIILKTNPMLDDYHTGIRKVEDIKTLGESVEEARSEAEKYGDDEWSAYPDITNDMLQNALETGEITIYSSKPIKNGVFVTPSYMQASDYAGGGNVYEKTVPLTDVAWINTDEGQYAKVDGERYSLKEVNDKFNDRLAQLIENPNQKDRVLHLGRSSQFLIDGGIADAEIELDFDKFVRKSSEKYKNNHPFSAGDIKDLPKAIAYPVAVFNSTTKKDHVVMTELNHDGKNFIVAIRATEQNRKNKVVLEVNQITSLYPKGERGIIYWINNNKLSNVDKEKALHFIEALQPHAGTLTSKELSSAANIVRNFVNPKQNDGNLQKTERYSLRVDRYRDELNQWKKDNNLPKDAERPQLPVREPNDRFGFT